MGETSSAGGSRVLVRCPAGTNLSTTGPGEKERAMSQPLPEVYLARHGETAWTVTGQHTGLTERGRRNARRLGDRLKGLSFAHVFTSPLQRARQTCELAGFGAAARVDPDPVEWNYGAYEGRRTADIRRERPDWEMFRDGCPGGEAVGEVSALAERVIARLRGLDGNALLFSSGHFLRVLGARWCGWEASAGRGFYLGTATLSAVGYEHDRAAPVVRLWNDGRHVGD
jgi:probable phosphoglycerate mutase